MPHIIRSDVDAIDETLEVLEAVDRNLKSKLDSGNLAPASSAHAKTVRSFLTDARTSLVDARNAASKMRTVKVSVKKVDAEPERTGVIREVS